MAPQLNARDDEDEYPSTSTWTSTSIDDDDLPTPTGKPYGAKPYPMATLETIIGVVPETTSIDYPWTHPNGGPPFNGRPTGPPSWVSGVKPSTSEWITTTKAIPLGDGVKSSQVTTSPFLVSTITETTHQYPSYAYGPGRPDWPQTKEKNHSGRNIAVATVASVVSLAVVGAIVFFCMRKRKRQRETPSDMVKAQEMKMQTQAGPTVQPYMASVPAPAVAPSYEAASTHLMPPASLSALAPIILGPIPSTGSNGLWGTGIDTSDVISVTSASHLRPGPPNPFSDNDSLAEPPPPYRPRSAAPPSLTNSSRQSSLRASAAPPTTSRTHLIERSPFEDPEDNDAVSELSGPTARQSDDVMSAVSDLSYQHDPIVNRSSS